MQQQQQEEEEEEKASEGQGEETVRVVWRADTCHHGAWGQRVELVGAASAKGGMEASWLGPTLSGAGERCC